MMSNHLTPGQRSMLADAMHARRRALLRQLETRHGGLSRVEHAREILEQDADDAAQHASDREVDLAFSDLDTQALQTIDLAIARLDDPRFGLCKDCGQTIAFDRLRAEPDAVRCIACATLVEQRST